MSSDTSTSDEPKKVKYAPRKKAHKSWSAKVSKQIVNNKEVALYSKVLEGKLHFLGEKRIVDFLANEDLKELTVENLILKCLELQNSTTKDHVYSTREFIPSVVGESDDIRVTFPKFGKPLKEWTSADARKELQSFMNALGFGYSFKTYGVATHEPKGWPRSVNWQLWRPNCSKKEQTKMIIRSILEAHSINPDIHHYAASSTTQNTDNNPGTIQSVSQNVPNEANDLSEPSSTSIDDDDGEQNIDRGEPSKKTKTGKRKREVDFSGADSDSEIEDGEISYHDYDDDTEQDINEVDNDLFASSEDEAEIRRRENLTARDAEINNLNPDRRNTGK